MNVQDLIDELQKIENKTLPVAVYADHGQVGMDAWQVVESYIQDPDEYMKEGVVCKSDWKEMGIDTPNYILIEG